ncbi:hypothetical protein HDV04_000087 [Boothiomyces sp. JEL0838]|nr:hypothetical protein HDV04_000087 [Boothiomyces sp. JEL0838]
MAFQREFKQPKITQYWPEPKLQKIQSYSQFASAAEPIERTHLTETITVKNHIITLKSILEDNLDHYKSLNLILFPVTYNNKFYRDIVENHPLEYCKIAYVNNQAVGAISCRREFVNGVYRVYIMTLGVLAPYRRYGIGSILLNKVLEACKNDLTVDHVCLHVQITNHTAIEFYKNAGFELTTIVQGYYESNVGVTPPHAYLVIKKL